MFAYHVYVLLITMVICRDHPGPAEACEAVIARLLSLPRYDILSKFSCSRKEGSPWRIPTVLYIIGINGWNIF